MKLRQVTRREVHLVMSTLALCLLWFCLVSPAASHVSPHSSYYGKVVQQAPISARNHYNRPRDQSASSIGSPVITIPSCNQLRELWAASIAQEWNPEGQHPNEIPRIVSNPYYLNLVLKSNKETSDNHFGKIITSPAEKKQLERENEEMRKHIPGNFDDYPVAQKEVGYTYGREVLSPKEAKEKLPPGVFGRFVTSKSDGEKSGDHSMGAGNGNGRERPIDTQSSSSSSSPNSESASSRITGSSLTANDFFNSMWHDKPVWGVKRRGDGFSNGKEESYHVDGRWWRHI